MLFESQIHDFKMILPWNVVKQEKTKLRSILLQKARFVTEEERAALSAQVCQHIEDTPEFQSANVVMLYYPIHHEIDVRPLIEKYAFTKTVLLPVSHHKGRIELRQFTSKEAMIKDHKGVPVPNTGTYKGEPEVIIIPGVGFDPDTFARMGRGGGYYDRFLKKQKAFKIGVCYDFQLIKDLPHWLHDQKMNRIVTPSQAIAK